MKNENGTCGNKETPLTGVADHLHPSSLIPHPSPRLSLPHVTLFCLDCIHAPRAVRVIEHCVSLCDFGAVKFLTSCKTDYPHEPIDPITGNGDQVQGLVNYSKWMLSHLHEHVSTSHVLTVQHDGWIVNPGSWDPSWLELDYIGPLFVQEPRVGSGGFSLRSKRLMQAVAEILPPFEDGHFGKTGYAFEDGVICCGLRGPLASLGMKFAHPEVAAKFAYGGNAAHYCGVPFGYHGFYALDTLLGGDGTPTPRNPKLETIGYEY